MAKKPKAIDANLIIRYLAEDDVRQAAAVEKLLKKAARNELEIPDVIIAEIVWVLFSFYKLSKEEIIEKLEGLLSLKKIKMNQRVLRRTVEIYRNYAISYTDAYLAAYALGNNLGQVYSFDKGLDQVVEIKRLEP
jgi:predicted nucleic acid-binding protein